MRLSEIFRGLPFALFVLCNLAAPLPSTGQRLSIGVVGGAGLTDGFRNETSRAAVLGGDTLTGSDTVYTHTYSTSKDYIVGGKMELALVSRLSVEVDGLYRPMNFTSFTSTVPSGGSAPANTVVTWEFPLLAKYQFQGTRVAPFLELGPSFRTSGNLNDTSPSNHGVAVGIGLEINLRKFGIAPQVRYTHWAADSVDRPSQPRTNQNQIEFLIGWSFHGPKGG
jgi:hypothetical protein